MTSARALLIINRRSGSAGGGIDWVVKQLQTVGIASTTFSPEEPGEISRIVSEESAGVDMIIMGGGDGTFSGSLAAVLKTELPLGVLPMRAANDFARSLGIPSNLSQAIDLIARTILLPPAERQQIPIGLLQKNDKVLLSVRSVLRQPGEEMLPPMRSLNWWSCKMTCPMRQAAKKSLSSRR